MGQKVASELVTVIDDGTIANRRGSLNVDDEGIADAAQCPHRERRARAATCRTGSTRGSWAWSPPATARRESYAHQPMPRMTNTFMLAGHDDPEDIIRSVPRGLYAVNFGGGQVDITSGKFVFSASEAYLIEDGKVTAAGQGRHAHRQRARRAHAGEPRRQRPQAGRRRRHLRQGRPVGAGRRRTAHHQDRRHDRRRDPGLEHARSPRRCPEAGDASGAPPPPTPSSWRTGRFSAQVRLGRVDTVKHAREQHLSLRVFAGKSAAAASTSDFSRASRGAAGGRGGLARPHHRARRAERTAGRGELARPMPALDLDDPTGHDLSPEDKIELARRCEAAALAARSAHHQLRGRRFRRPARPLRLRGQPRLRRRVRDLVLQPVRLPGGLGERQHAARRLVSRHAQARAPRRAGADRQDRRPARPAPPRAPGRSRPCEVPVDLRPRDGGEPRAAHRRRRRRARALPRRLLPPRQARPADRGARRDHRGRWHHAGRAGLAALRRRGLAGAADGDRGQGRARPRTSSTPTAAASSAWPRRITPRATAAASRSARPTSTSTAGASDPKDLIRSVKQGLYVTELIGFGVNGVTGDYSRGAVGLWIDNGELAYPGRGDHDRGQPARDVPGHRRRRQRPGLPRPHRRAHRC